MKYFFFVAFLSISFLYSTCFAQEKQYVFLLKNNGEHVHTKDSMNYIRVVTGPIENSKLYNVAEYYPSGKPKSAGQSSGIDPVIWEGAYIAYWPNGNKKTSAAYKKNKLTGTDSSFFSNGKLHYVMEYTQSDSTLNDPNTQWLTAFIKTCNDSTGKVLLVNGNGYFVDYDDSSSTIAEEGNVKQGKRIGEWKGGNEKEHMTYKETYDTTGTLISGTSTDQDGTHSYKTRHVSAQFKGGYDAFYKYLGRTTRYPAIARENNIQGKVILSFTVNKLGKLEHIEVRQTVSPEIDAESVRVLNSSPEWTPGMEFGRKVNQLYYMPLTFSLTRR